jgi:ribosomal-protein-alanine N-acetyltransferase
MPNRCLCRVDIGRAPRYTGCKRGTPMTTTAYIETSRLILRTVTMADADNVALIWNLDGSPLRPAETQARISWMLANQQQNAPGKLVYLGLVMIAKDTGEFIGCCGLDRDKGNPVLFYWLKRSHRGKGLATEAARAVLDHAFTGLALLTVNGATAFDNTASKRVMEKLGMVYVGLDEEGGHFFTLTLEGYFNRAKNG